LEVTESQMNEAMLTRLGALKSQPKFVDEPGTIYNGMRPEEVRRAAEIQLDDLIERLMRDPGDTPAQSFVLAQFRQALARFPGYDTEDRERMCRYLRQILDILGIESSGGLLARWLHGPILGTLILLTRRDRPS
jgi:hypothetical protein